MQVSRHGPRKDTPRNEEADIYYNDRALFLAQSAPGSREGTPATSRPVSPAPHALFRTVASTSGLHSMLNQASVMDGLSIVSQKNPGKPKGTFPKFR